MSFLRTLKKLVLGETWTLPIGLGAVFATAVLIVRPMLGHSWNHLGGIALLAGVALVLIVSVTVTARPPR